MSFRPDHISKREAEAKAFLTEIEGAMDDEGPWVYGKNGPTMLDAHFAVFLARMFDVGRTTFFTVELSRHLEAIEKRLADCYAYASDIK